MTKNTKNTNGNAKKIDKKTKVVREKRQDYHKCEFCGHWFDIVETPRCPHCEDWDFDNV